MSTTVLKLFALITMLIDHIGFFIPNMPEWLRYIGRLSAPIFLFCAVIGYSNTSNKKKYLFRIYAFSVFMGIIDAIILQNINYIRTIFITLLILFLIDCFQSQNKYAKKYLCIFLLWQVVVNTLYIMCIINMPDKSTVIILPLFVISAYMNYGILFVVLGICMYLFLHSYKKFSISYILITFTILIFQNTNLLYRIGNKITYIAITSKNNLLMHLKEIFEFFCSAFLDIEIRFLKNDLWYTTQWLMIFSLPLLLLYNGKKGKGLKYLFYIMYPFNIIVFYYIGVSMGNVL
ncbi:MAG: hypothetical protein HFE58_02295 [Firmicutes bacterium]|jgi:hypothetical protein|nr:hypothetical protein [Bacillota bacterium]